MRDWFSPGAIRGVSIEIDPPRIDRRLKPACIAGDVTIVVAYHRD